jgi:hypothetical protein
VQECAQRRHWTARERESTGIQYRALGAVERISSRRGSEEAEAISRQQGAARTPPPIAAANRPARTMNSRRENMVPI